jgi:hypothetical protein
MSDDSIREQLKALKERADETWGVLQELRDRVLTMPICPMPGTCVPLQRQTGDHETRIRALEDALAQARGVGAMARLIWSAIGGMIAGAVILLIKKL